MYAYTMSTVADCAYRTADTLTITPRDEGAEVWRLHVVTARREFIGTIIDQRLRTAAGVASLRAERIEVPAPRAGRPGYRWTNGYYVAVNGEFEAHPPVSRHEAYAMAREAGCKLIVMLG
jgi:hypothetical protein